MQTSDATRQGAPATQGRLNPLMAKVLENRGYDEGFLSEISVYEHGELHGTDRLTEALGRIHDEGVPITIYPDFDMDGIMSGTVLYAGLSELGFDVSLYVPDPSAGYGITPRSVEHLVGQFPRTQAIITCDVGITAFDGISKANELGIEVLVTDHHAQAPEGLPEASVIVDPMQDADGYAHPQICGAYVAYQCLMAYAKARCDPRMVSHINRLRVFSGVGTISDSMPLLYENRHLVSEMTSIMQWLYGDATARNAERMPGCPTYRKAFLGLHMVLMALLDNGSLRNGASSINEETVGFYIAPMFNAVKRLDGDMSRAFGVFFGDQQMSDIDYLIRMNEQRKKIVEAEYRRLDDRVITDDDGNAVGYRHVFTSDARPGVLGLLGNKVLGETGEPAFILTRRDDGWAGSGRCPAWLPALTMLRDGLGYSLAGHQGAFGIKVPEEVDGRPGIERLDEDVTAIIADLREQGLVVEAKPDFVLSVDGTDTSGADIEWDAPMLVEFADQLEELRPFGEGFPKPTGVLRFTFLGGTGDVRAIGRDMTHAKAEMNGLEILMWRQYDKFVDLDYMARYECVLSGYIGLNEFNGRRKPAFTGDVIDIRKL